MTARKTELTGTESVKDYYLCMQVVGVNLSEDEDVSVPLTLMASGTVVAGHMIPAWKWLQEAFQPSDGSAAAGVYHKSGEQMQADVQRVNGLLAKQQAGEEIGPEDEELLDRHYNPSFLCLRDAKFHGGHGDMYPTNQGMHVRLRLGSVDAWTVGVLGRNDEN